MFFGITNIWAYVIGAFLIILLPGPNSLYVLTMGAQRGVRSGYRAAAGVFVGDSVLMVLSAAGVASLLQSSPLLFGIVKYSGAAYLAWLGFNMIRAARRSWRGEDRPDDRPVEQAPDLADPFRKALTISLLNPKAILFFISFFVQFVDPHYGAPALSFLILGAICQFFSVLYLSALIFGGSYLAGQFRRRRRLSAGLTSGVGAIFLAFGAKLATSSLS
ncbi:leucine efflux protein [Sphaerisporangium melleum]|uniref:Leucine efflux protein n=1 Tax=Sphaerisporangium melleum TaxID=321316 RepID=A0A917RMY3_9ACTN|nr:leucine efflux protein LeuE [Sphaerisporangium melleum]GGL15268.1 leucine efflux protein [Sphaerisporangium melleum]GII74537.1 leucine efflux protein [Sphaerisporangium melleum]